jgi:hypothetical protein
VSLLDRVLSDLPVGLRPRVERTPEYDDPVFDRVGVSLIGREMTFGAFVPIRGDDADRLTDLAHQVQDWAVEELWMRGESAVWPECPAHPDGHPLRAAAGAWHCPKTGHVVARIGEL